MSKHKVRIHKGWNQGALRLIQKEFKTEEEALEFIKDYADSEIIKIYNEDGNLTHNITPSTLSDSYA